MFSNLLKRVCPIALAGALLLTGCTSGNMGSKSRTVWDDIGDVGSITSGITTVEVQGTQNGTPTYGRAVREYSENGECRYMLDGKETADAQYENICEIVIKSDAAYVTLGDKIADALGSIGGLSNSPLSANSFKIPYSFISENMNETEDMGEESDSPKTSSLTLAQLNSALILGKQELLKFGKNVVEVAELKQDAPLYGSADGRNTMTLTDAEGVLQSFIGTINSSLQQYLDEYAEALRLNDATSAIYWSFVSNQVDIMSTIKEALEDVSLLNYDFSKINASCVLSTTMTGEAGARVFDGTIQYTMAGTSGYLVETPDITTDDSFNIHITVQEKQGNTIVAPESSIDISSMFGGMLGQPTGASVEPIVGGDENW